MKVRKYSLYKDATNNDIVYLEYNENQKFEIKPKNALANYMNVDKMMIISSDFSRKIIKKILDNKIEYFIESLLPIMEEDSDVDDDGIALLLDECESFKITCISKYMAFLTSDELKEIFYQVDLIYDKIKSINFEKNKFVSSFGRSR